MTAGPTYPMVALRRLFSIVNGATPDSQNEAFWGGAIPWVTPEDLSGRACRGIAASKRTLTAAGYESCGTTLVPPGSIVLSTRAPIGNLAITVVELCTNQGCKALVPDESVDARFMHYALAVSTAELNQRGRGTTFLELSSAELAAFKVPSPARSTQCRIANFLDEQTARIDALIAEKTRLQQAVEEYGNAEVSRLLAQGTEEQILEPTGNAFVPLVPRGWKVASFKRALLGMEQGWSPQCDSRPAQDGEWGVLKVGCVNGLRFAPEENKALPDDLQPDLICVIKAGDVLVSRANTRELVGMAALVTEEHPNLLLCDKLYRLRLRADWVTPAFTVLALRAEASRRQIELGASGASASMQNISQDVLRELTVAFPPLEEQARIVERAARVRAATQGLLQHVAAHVDRLREYRSSLISAAVTGQLDLSTFEAKLPEAA